jgi:hypothetical protein
MAASGIRVSHGRALPYKHVLAGEYPYTQPSVIEMTCSFCQIPADKSFENQQNAPSLAPQPRARGSVLPAVEGQGH